MKLLVYIMRLKIQRECELQITLRMKMERSELELSEKKTELMTCQTRFALFLGLYSHTMDA